MPKNNLKGYIVKLSYNLNTHIFSDDNLKEDIRFALAQGIQLLHILMVKDTDFCVHMNKAEGEYNLVIRGLKNIGSENLKLDKIQGENYL